MFISTRGVFAVVKTKGCLFEMIFYYRLVGEDRGEIQYIRTFFHHSVAEIFSFSLNNGTIVALLSIKIHVKSFALV